MDVPPFVVVTLEFVPVELEFVLDGVLALFGGPSPVPGLNPSLTLAICVGGDVIFALVEGGGAKTVCSGTGWGVTLLFETVELVTAGIIATSLDDLSGA